MTKTCPEHGETEELYFGDYEMYRQVRALLEGRQGHPRAERAHGRLLVPRQLRVMLQPPLAHRALQHHHHEQVRPDVLVLLLLRQEGPRGRLRLRAHHGPGQGDGQDAKGREAGPRELGPAHRRRAHHPARAARDNQDDARGGHRPRPAQHQRDQPRARPVPRRAAPRGRRSLEPLHVVRRHHAQDQPQEPLGGALHARGVQEEQHRRRPRPDGHQDASTTTSSAR